VVIPDLHVLHGKVNQKVNELERGEGEGGKEVKWTERKLWKLQKGKSGRQADRQTDRQTNEPSNSTFLIGWVAPSLNTPFEAFDKLSKA
jgi:hypothetical protein